MYSSLRTALLTGGLTFSVIVGTLSVYALGAGTDIVALMDKMLLDTSISTDGTVKNSDKVDGLHASDILNAAGGGGGVSCYYTNSPSCMTGYGKAPGVYQPGSLGHNICCTLDTNTVCSSFSAGSSCQGNTVYAFYLAGSHYMTTPGNCDNYTTPFCNGTVDTMGLVYKSSPVDAYLANSTTDGSGNTTALSTTHAPASAAQYCYNMIYGGYSDWFLPAVDQLQKMNIDRAAIGGFAGAAYWSSTNAGGDAYIVTFGSSSQPVSQNITYRVRCIRKI